MAIAEIAFLSISRAINPKPEQVDSHYASNLRIAKLDLVENEESRLKGVGERQPAKVAESKHKA